MNGASGWAGRLRLDHRRDGDRTVAHDRHQGPLRVLQRLQPEGPGICHHVLVLPPGGIVGGDTLAVDVTPSPDGHALLTTPGAARCHRSDGAPACQTLQATLATGARLEWLPIETIADAGCVAENRLELHLAPGAVVLRVLADRVEPAMALLQAVRSAWRHSAWRLAAAPPRIWRT